MTSTERSAGIRRSRGRSWAGWPSRATADLGAAAWRLLTDVRFAVAQILLIALAGLVGMLVRQFPVTAADDPARYAIELAAMERAWAGIAPFGLELGPALVGVFDTLGFFSVFSSPWFLLLMTVLTISIVCCTLDRTPKLWRGVREVQVEQAAPFFDPRLEHRALLTTGTGPRLAQEAVARAFRGRHFRRQRRTQLDEATIVYGDRNQYMKLATLLTHAGLVLFLAGGAVTVAAGFETVLFVGEGQTAPVQRVGTPDNLLVKNHGFDAPRRADGSFADFSTDLSVFRAGEEVARKRIRVNDPLVVDGFVFHQNTFGPSVDLTIRDADGELAWSGPIVLADEVVGRPQGFMTIPGADVGLVVVLGRSTDGAAHLVLQGVGAPEGGMADAPDGGPIEGRTLFLVSLPLGITTDPEVTAGHAVTWAGVGAWSGMVVKSDPGQPIIWLAFGLLIAGLVLTFYFPRRRAWARIEGDQVSLAFIADRYVDRDGEFRRLTQAVSDALAAESSRR